MNQWLLILVALGTAGIGLQLLKIAVMAIAILRAPVWPTRVIREQPSNTDQGTLPPTHRAALAEIEALGFVPIWLGEMEIGPRRVPSALLAHRDGRSFCGITFQPLPLTGYPITFYGFSASGQILETTNRRAWARAGRAPRRSIDVVPADLAGHWAAHQQHWGSEAQPIDHEAARAALWSTIDDFLGELRRDGAVTDSDHPAHFRIRAALRMATRFYRAQRRLATPYASAVTAEPLRADFFVERIDEMEQQMEGRSGRPDLKAAVLVLSLVISLALWGIVFDWRRAVIVVAVILVHEFGHAIAMRAFGWRDLSMFFIPFLGAIVTGKPSEVSAWKQVIILLAGPLPGLLFGVGLLAWLGATPDVPPVTAAAVRDGALIAVTINLFNLLPFTPLDGGRLLEIALFSRWPLLRGVFALLSVGAFAAIASWLHSPSLWVIVGILVLGMRSQWTMARLQSAWDTALPRRDQLVRILSVLENRLRVVSFTRQWALVRAVSSHAKMGKPRAWESAMTMTIMVGVWLLPGAYVADTWQRADRHVIPDSRTEAQRDFDGLLDADDEEEPNRAAIQGLAEKARRLAADDPRQVDLAVMQAMAEDAGVREDLLGRIVQQGRDGIHWSIHGIIRSQLSDAYSDAAQLPANARRERLQAALAWADRVAPGALAPTIEVRLRAAEALDEGGDTAGARAELAGLAETARTADDCACELHRVMRARAWFHLSHGENVQALALFKALAEGNGHPPRWQAALDLAWALELNGDTDAGLAQMRAAAFATHASAGWLQRAATLVAPPARLLAPLDLAFALRRAGRDADARSLLANRGDAECRAVISLGSFHEVEGPWQRERDRLIVETARAACPAAVPRTGS